MQASETHHLAPLKIDVAQWRRDIQTFVVSTQRELQAIRDELSGGVGGPVAHRAGPPRSERNEPARVPVATKAEPVARSAVPACDLPPHDRLAMLKQKLAAQMASGATAAPLGKLAPGAERTPS